MPARKRTALDHRAPASKRRRTTRSQETSEQRQERLSVQRERQTRVRNRETEVQETSEQRQERLSVQRERQARVRNRETDVQTQARLSTDRERHVQRRHEETEVQTQARLSLFTAAFFLHSVTLTYATFRIEEGFALRFNAYYYRGSRLLKLMVCKVFAYICLLLTLRVFTSKL